MCASKSEWAMRIGYPIFTFIASLLLIVYPESITWETIDAVTPAIFIIWLLGCSAGLLVMVSLWTESKEAAPLVRIASSTGDSAGTNVLKYAYIEVALPEGKKVTVQDLEKQTGGTVHYMSKYPLGEQTLILDSDTGAFIQELEERGYSVTKKSKKATLSTDGRPEKKSDAQKELESDLKKWSDELESDVRGWSKTQ